MSEIKVIENISFQVSFKLESISDEMDIKFDSSRSTRVFSLGDVCNFLLEDVDALVNGLTVFRDEAMKRGIIGDTYKDISNIISY